MRVILVLTVFVASPFLVHGSDPQDCSATHEYPDMPESGLRWITSSKCFGCKDQECYGCFNSDISTCARCVSDEITCNMVVGKEECSKFILGGTLRGDKDKCTGTIMPFEPAGDEGFHYGLCPGNDITMKTNESMTVAEARNLCALYSPQDDSAACYGFTWKVPSTVAQERATVNAPLTCPADKPAGGIMWRKAPNCVGCVGDFCIGCQSGDTSDCARCVYDKEACYRSETKKEECDRLIYGARLRKEDKCDGGVPPVDKFQFKFKNAWHPHKKQGDCPPPASKVSLASLKETVDESDRSMHVSYVKFPRHKLVHPTRQTDTMLLGDFVKDTGATGCDGCKAFSYPRHPGSSAGAIVHISTDGQLIKNASSVAYKVFQDDTAELLSNLMV